MNISGKPLSCVEVNKRDIVDYLRELSFEPTRISRQHYWYLSPFRGERTASFKVNRDMNRWYDFGEGKGGTLIDFGVLYFRCSVSDFLQQLPIKNFNQQPIKKYQSGKENEEEPIRIVKAKSIDSPPLLSYLKQRKIDVGVARQWCREITFTLHQKSYYAIGFLNDAGGYELRNEFFKGSTHPKDITTISNDGKSLSLFEGFFDFLSYLSIYQNCEEASQNFIILNSLSFLPKAESHLINYKAVNLFLDRDTRGQKGTCHLLSLGSYITDKSNLYQHHKDFNDWLMNFGLADTSLHSEQ